MSQAVEETIDNITEAIRCLVPK